MHTKPRLAPYARQQGLVLGIALIFLLLFALLGVAALQASALEQIMAANSQRSYRVFQAIESGIDAALRDAARQRSRPHDLSGSERSDRFNGITVTRRIEYQGAAHTVPDGYSLRGAFRAHHFTIRAETGTASGVAAAHERGMAVIGPGDR